MATTIHSAGAPRGSLQPKPITQVLQPPTVRSSTEWCQSTSHPPSATAILCPTQGPRQPYSATHNTITTIHYPLGQATTICYPQVHRGKPHLLTTTPRQAPSVTHRTQAVAIPPALPRPTTHRALAASSRHAPPGQAQVTAHGAKATASHYSPAPRGFPQPSAAESALFSSGSLCTSGSPPALTPLPPTLQARSPGVLSSLAPETSGGAIT